MPPVQTRLHLRRIHDRWCRLWPHVAAFVWPVLHASVLHHSKGIEKQFMLNECCCRSIPTRGRALQFANVLYSRRWCCSGVDRDMFHRLIDGGRVEALYSTPLSLARARLRIRDAGCTPLERTRRRWNVRWKRVIEVKVAQLLRWRREGGASIGIGTMSGGQSSCPVCASV